VESLPQPTPEAMEAARLAAVVVVPEKKWLQYVTFAAVAIPVLAFFAFWDFEPAAAPVATVDGKTIALIPPNEVPKASDDLTTTIDLIDKYPQDPRGHMFRGIYFLEHKQLGDAERELRAALEHPEILKRDMPADVEIMVRMTLAIVLDGRGKHPDAVRIAQPICGKDLGGADYEFRTWFIRTHACPA
jgi:hypothetical protein